MKSLGSVTWKFLTVCKRFLDICEKKSFPELVLWGVFCPLTLLFPLQDLPDSHSELTSHISTFLSLQRTSPGRDPVDVSHEKLHKDSALLDPKVRCGRNSQLLWYLI